MKIIQLLSQEYIFVNLKNCNLVLTLVTLSGTRLSKSIRVLTLSLNQCSVQYQRSGVGPDTGATTASCAGVIHNREQQAPQELAFNLPLHCLSSATTDPSIIATSDLRDLCDEPDKRRKWRPAGGSTVSASECTGNGQAGDPVYRDHQSLYHTHTQTLRIFLFRY